MTNLALRVELARAFGEVIARGLARAAINAGALTPGLGGRAVGRAELNRGAIGFEGTHDLRLVAASRAGEGGDRRRACLARESVDETDAARGFVYGQAEHRRGIELASVNPGPERQLGRASWREGRWPSV